MKDEYENYVRAGRFAELRGMPRWRVYRLLDQGRIERAVRYRDTIWVPLDAWITDEQGAYPVKEVPTEGYISRTELAERLGVGWDYVDRLRRDNRVVGARKRFGQWEFPPDPEVLPGEVERPGKVQRYIRERERRMRKNREVVA